MSSVDSKLDDIKKLLEVNTSSLQEIKENQAKMKTDFEKIEKDVCSHSSQIGKNQKDIEEIKDMMNRERNQSSLNDIRRRINRRLYNK